MIFLLFGFNGFGQCCHSAHKKGICEDVISRKSQLHKIDAHDISFSWSKILIISASEIRLYGFINGKENAIEVVHPEKITILKGYCTRDYCIFLDENGKPWKFEQTSGLWKDLSNFLIAENGENSSSIRKVCCGETMVIALSSLGAVYNVPNILSLPQIKVVDVGCGREHGLFLTETGSVYSWGGGSRGQLGTNDLASTEEPCEVTALGGMYVVKIAAGGWHSCAVTKEGALYTWGWNNRGQLGHPMMEESKAGVSILAEPRFVDWPNDMNYSVQQVSCGTSHTVAKLEGGTVWGCGWNKWGQLVSTEFDLISRMTEIPLPEGYSVEKVVCGSWSTGFAVSETICKNTKDSGQ